MISSPESHAEKTSLTAPLTVGQIIDLTVDALVSDGRGLGRTEGMVVLVPDALPGQTVRVEVESVRRRLAEGRVLAVLVPSAHERAALCPHEQCGGCAWQCLQLEQQHLWKERIIHDALTRLGKLHEPPMLPLLASPAEWGYRNKMEFAFTADEGNVDNPYALRLGLRERRSRQVVEVTDCRLQSPLTMRVLAWLREATNNAAREEGLPAWNPETRSGFWRFVVVRQTGMGREVTSEVKEASQCLVEVITIPHPDGIEATVRLAKALGDGLRAALPEVTGFVFSERNAWEDVAYGEHPRYSQGQSRLVEQVGTMRCAMTTQAFFQVNTQATERLYEEAARLLALDGTQTVWDLYCGAGAIGLSLAPKARRVFGADVAPKAVAMATAAAADMGFAHCTFEAGDALVIMRRFAAPDVVIVDPPRAGLNENVVRALIQVGAKQLLYVSCNPATLARDAALMSGRYTLKAVRPVDLFPQTPHVETLALFVLR